MAIPDRSALVCTAALAVALGAAALLGGALAFEHLGGLAPCDLCLPQRGPHAAVIVVAAWAAVCAGLAPRAAAGLLAAAVPVLILSFGLALHHAGVEQHWWAGPAACTGTGGGLSPSADDLAQALKTAHIVRCDRIAFEMFGISLAGYNALFSVLLALIASAPWITLRARGESR